MRYAIRIDRIVAAQVARLPPELHRYWEACLAEIAKNPFPRFGLYVDHVPPLPSTTYLFEITQEESISTEHIFVFTSEFLAEWSPVYVVDGEDVVIFYLRRIP